MNKLNTPLSLRILRSLPLIVLLIAILTPSFSGAGGDYYTEPACQGCSCGSPSSGGSYTSWKILGHHTVQGLNGSSLEDAMKQFDGSNLTATIECNEWTSGGGIHIKLKVRDEFKVCGWKSYTTPTPTPTPEPATDTTSNATPSSATGTRAIVVLQTVKVVGRGDIPANYASTHGDRVVAGASLKATYECNKWSDMWDYTGNRPAGDPQLVRGRDEFDVCGWND